MKRPDSNELIAAADLILDKLDEVYDDPIIATVKIKCPECNGTGTVQHRLWAEFYDRWANADQHQPLDDAALEFFRARGYDRDEIPPEERDCGCCAGTGKAKKTIGLSELFREMIEREVKKEVSDEHMG